MGQEFHSFQKRNYFADDVIAGYDEDRSSGVDTVDIEESAIPTK